MQRFAQALFFVTAAGLTAAACSASSGQSLTSSATHNTGASTSTSSGAGGGGQGGANASSGSQGGQGVFATVGSSSGGMMCMAYKSCAMQGVTCGSTSDGCGNILNCGACSSNQSCEMGKCTDTCTPKTTCAAGTDCGSASDGCSGTITCGPACPSGKTCGAQTQNVCGTGGCTPKTCTELGFMCGMQGDTCGGTIDCGSCANGQTCGANSMPGQCVSTCAAKTCTSQNFNCGMATDGCGNTIDCGTCPAGSVCGAGGPNQCGSGMACTGLCLQQTTCPGTATTSVSGKVYTPNGTDPLPNALIYVPNGSAGAPTYGVTAFSKGVSCGTCGTDVSGSPLISTVSAVDGTFTLTNMPVGSNIPLVIQNGRWRRKISISTVKSCTNTALTAAQTSMPKTQGMGDPADNIPLMAFSTGSVDSLECVMRKIGVADSQFSDPGGTGRIQFYVGDQIGGAQISNNTPTEDQLWGTQAAINQYDMVYFPCQGTPYTQSSASLQVLVDYANAGGRVFATHYSYAWLYNNTYVQKTGQGTFESTATWTPDAATFFTNDPGTGLINQGFPEGATLAKWLKLLYPTSTLGQIAINTLRNDMSAVAAPPTAYLWITDDNDPSAGSPPMHYTFNTPVGAPVASQCGRVLYDDFHVEDAENNPTTGVTFPGECDSNPMTPQEKMLEFMIFDLGSCVDSNPTCKPSTCSDQKITCGAAADGCGNIIQCGMCPSGESCIAGSCANACTPQTCASQKYTCGMQGDGCGNTLNCGSCPSGMSCSNGSCSTGTCTPKNNCPQGANCGTVSDGCSGTINCGTCTAPDTCGGGGTPNVCGAPKCTPKTCTEQGFNCGSATDGCGNTINCGTCTAPETCGGGQPAHANVCGGGSGS